MASTEPKPQPDAKNQGVPDQKKLEQSIVAARNAVKAQNAAVSLKERAMKVIDPKERMRLLQDAYHKEVEAHGQSKYAKRLQSGSWQGAAAGGGIGGGVAMGLGAVVGTLVTGLAGLPTVLAGGLVGAGVGGIHGPFIKLGGGESQKPMTQEEIHAQAVKEAEELDQAVEKGASTVPQPPQLEEVDGTQVESGEQHASDEAAPEESAAQTSKKAPRKLEVRSANEIKAPPEKKKPRKLEVRSGSEKKENV